MRFGHSGGFEQHRIVVRGSIDGLIVLDARASLCSDDP